jgi:hypothetical protein
MSNERCESSEAHPVSPRRLISSKPLNVIASLGIFSQAKKERADQTKTVAKNATLPNYSTSGSQLGFSWFRDCRLRPNYSTITIVPRL